MGSPKTKADGRGADSSRFFDIVRELKSDIDGTTPADRGGSSDDLIAEAMTSEGNVEKTTRVVLLAQEVVIRGSSGGNINGETRERISRPSPTKNDDRSVKGHRVRA